MHGVHGVHEMHAGTRYDEPPTISSSSSSSPSSSASLSDDGSISNTMYKPQHTSLMLGPLGAKSNNAVHLCIPELQELRQREGGVLSWLNQLPHVMPPIDWVALLHCVANVVQLQPSCLIVPGRSFASLS